MIPSGQKKSEVILPQVLCGRQQQAHRANSRTCTRSLSSGQREKAGSADSDRSSYAATQHLICHLHRDQISPGWRTNSWPML